jgi:hypothetical protein
MTNDRDDDKTPEEIQRDISSIRAQVSSTIDAIQSKLTPGQMMDQALDFFRSGKGGGGTGDTMGAVGQGANEFAGNLSRAMRDNPLPVAVIGLGLAWLMVADRSGRSPRQAGSSIDHDRSYDRDFDRIDRSIGMRGSMGSTGMSSGAIGSGGAYPGASGSRPSMYGGAGDGSTSITDHAPSGLPMTAGSGSDEPGMLSSAADKLADAGRTVRDKASDLAAGAAAPPASGPAARAARRATCPRARASTSPAAPRT